MIEVTLLGKDKSIYVADQESANRVKELVDAYTKLTTQTLRLAEQVGLLLTALNTVGMVPDANVPSLTELLQIGEILGRQQTQKTSCGVLSSPEHTGGVP